MLKNAHLLSKIAADTAENEQKFAEILAKIGNSPTGPLPPAGAAQVLPADLDGPVGRARVPPRPLLLGAAPPAAALHGCISR